jgi:hypothetical protein
MSPAATLGYEWQILPSRKREQSVCKLPKPQLPSHATAADGSRRRRPRAVSMTGTDHRGAVCGETRTHGFEGERGAARPLA